MYLLSARQNPLDEAKNTLSSWDNCMAKAYCKWPVIVGIIVGSLILISVITCIARCICCGAECACCCFRCCTCCCSGSDRGHKRMKSDPSPSYPTPYGAPPPMNPYAQAHAAAPPPPVDARPINQQYRSNAMPSFGVAPTPHPERPQFATFDSTKAVVNEDALPAMPTWKDGRDVHVEVEEQPIPEKRGDMEMHKLNHNGSVSNGSVAGVAAVPGARRSPGSGRSPTSPVGVDQYGFPPGYQNNAPAHRNSPSPYGSRHDDYRQASPNPSAALMPGGTYAQDQSYGRRSPSQPQAHDMYDERDQYPQQQPQHHQPRQYDQYDQRDYYDEPAARYQSPAPAPVQNHSNAHVYQSNQAPAYNDPYDGPAPPPGAQRSNSPLSGTTRYEPPSTSPAPAYPGQQTYNTTGPGYPGQQAYQAFQPSTGVARKPVNDPYYKM